MSARDFRKKQAHIPIAREGIPYILAAMFATFVTAVLGWAVVTLVLLAAALLIGHFFRDPERVAAGPQLHKWVAGGTVGGPVFKNKLFFFRLQPPLHIRSVRRTLPVPGSCRSTNQ